MTGKEFFMESVAINNKRTRLIAAILSLATAVSVALLCLSLFGSTKTSATGKGVDYDLNEDGVPYLNIVSYNVEYGDFMHIAYAVQYSNDFVGENAEFDVSEVRMIFWNGGQSDYTLENAENIVFVAAPDDAAPPAKYSNCRVFLSDDIPAKNIVDTIYARAYVEAADGTIYYSNVSKYSVLQYVYDRYAALDASTATDAETLAKEAAQRELYDRILAYGAAAQKIFGYKEDSLAIGDYVQISVVGATMDDGMNRGLYCIGDTITLKAKPPIEGIIPSYWTNSDGEKIADDTDTLVLTIDESFPLRGTITAVYNIPTIVKVTGGSGSGEYRFGESYVVSASTSEHFAYWLVNGMRSYEGKPTVTVVVNDMLGGNVTYEAVYYQPTVVTVNGGSGSGSYYYGESYTVAPDSTSGKPFSHWIVNGTEKLESESFTVTVDSELGSEITYEAVYINGEGAHFEDIQTSDSYITSKSPASSGGYQAYYNVAEENRHAVVAKNPNPSGINTSENCIYTVKTATGDGKGGSLLVKAGTAMNTDEWCVFSADVYVEPTADNTVIAQIGLGNTSEFFYRLELRVQNGKILIYDYNSDAMGAGRNYLGATASFDNWFHIEIKYTAGNGITVDESKFSYDDEGNVSNLKDAITSNDTRAYVYVNGECYAKSSNIWSYDVDAEDANRLLSTLTSASFYSMKNERVTMYVDNVVLKTEEVDESTIQYKTSHTVPVEGSDFENRYMIADAVIGTAATDALKDMDADLFGQDIYLWLARLYDQKTGAFYYSNSARDNYGFLPDIESTSQALTILYRLGITSSSNGRYILTEEERARLGAWIQMCQSGRDGYYYHPQWGTNIGDSRKGRDLGNFTNHLNYHALGEELFDGANYRLSGFSTDYANLAGSTAKQTYAAPDVAMVMSLGRSTRAAVAMAVSSVVEDEEYLPETSNSHLQSEAAFRQYLDERWVIHKYNSYSFGNYITSQNSQVEAANLSHVIIEYLNNIMHKVQTELEARALDAYYSDRYGVDKSALDKATAYRDARADGTVAGMDAADSSIDTERAAFRAKVEATAGYVALTDAEIAEITKDAGNGLWETTVDGRTISGLLKISGIYNHHAAEIPYVDKTMKSAISVLMMDVDDYIADEGGITYIYNPPNAINNLLNNIKNFGASENAQVRAAAYSLLQNNAEQIIVKTHEKLSLYARADGGFGYHINKSSHNSQGEPAGVSGAIESDVNGTGLAIGTRNALISIFSLSAIKLLPSGITEVYLNEGGEQLVFSSHAECFRYALENHDAGKIVKSVGAYDFESVTTMDEVENKYSITTSGAENQSAVSVIAKDGNASNKALHYIVQNLNNKAGAHVYFSSAASASNVNYYSVEFDMYDDGSSTTGQYEIFFYNSSTSFLKLLCKKNDSGIYFQNQYKYDQAGNSVAQSEEPKTPTKYFSAKEWMHVSIKYYPDAVATDGSSAPYGVLEVTQGSSSFSLTFNNTWGSARDAFDKFDMYASHEKYGNIYIDDIRVTNYTDGGEGLGYYHFDDVTDSDSLPQMQLYRSTSAVGTSHGEKTTDKYLALSASEGGSMALRIAAQNEKGYYNFNEIQMDMRFDNYAVGDTGSFSAADSSGEAIVTIGYEIISVMVGGKAYDSVRFFEATSGATLLAGQYDADLEKDTVTVDPLDYVITPDDWITLRFEYHYDMSTPTLYLTAAYTDASGLADAKAAILEGLTTGGTPADMSSLLIEAESDGISIDDLYVRRVYNVK